MTIDLAARWLGGGVVAASDESFGSKESLLVEGAPRFEPGRYDHRGEIVDGWETRRRRDLEVENHNADSDAFDWVILRLGAPGLISSVSVSTLHFTGNFPATARVEALGSQGYPSAAELAAAEWTEIAARQPLAGDTDNLLQCESNGTRYTHVRLSAFPDGGIARVRVHGTVIPDPRFDGLSIEVSSPLHGGTVLSSSNDFYTSAACLIRPDTPRTMGEGWETSRRRGPGHDTVRFGFAVAARLTQVEIDTTYFKYNSSASVTLYSDDDTSGETAKGRLLLSRTVLQPDTRHRFLLPPGDPVTGMRLDAFPDGGLARVRVFGQPTSAARAKAEQVWLNALPANQRRMVLSETEHN